ncbi:O-antigen ligase like membrane protein [Paucidesulfovibrio gracilis DSM 16080]|uniref:O-antigen ligase like membrane protein n=1 Tax=Paucidesulfovibrio gracilis DSM 16080 TaxID=1121449 RepID=A0A1T4XF73_9BACT|nr:O-antigen ligase family protein [Paucidesulfovibrio gracilis]SKA87705.1 O-antigen ligase like membrane protein [Paucidesulfovibrio gracilis DSM 16080]
MPVRTGTPPAFPRQPGAAAPRRTLTIRRVVTVYVGVVLAILTGFLYAGFGLDGFRDNILTVALLYGCIGLFTLVVNPAAVLGVIFAFFPFSYQIFKVEVGIITFNPYSAGLLLFAGIAVLRLIFQRARLKLTLTDLFLAGVCVVYFIGTLRSPDVVDSGFLAFNFLFQPVVAYYVLRVMITNEEEYRSLLRYMVLGMLGFAVMAVAFWLQTGQRAIPLGTPAISTATLMAFGACLVMGSDVVPRKLRIPLALLCVAAMFLTFSRVFLVLSVLTPFCYLLIKKGKAITLFVAFFGASLLATFMLIIYAQFIEPDQTIFTAEEYRTEQRLTNVENWKDALYGRVAQFQSGLSNFLEHPFLGLGLYRGPQVITQHNFHVEWLEYSGVVGYALYLFFLLSHAARMNRFAPLDHPIRWQLLATLLVLNNCLFNGIMHGFMPHVVFICMGLSEARSRFPHLREQAASERAEESRSPGPKPEPLSTPDRFVVQKETGEELYRRYFSS